MYCVQVVVGSVWSWWACKHLMLWLELLLVLLLVLLLLVLLLQWLLLLLLLVVSPPSPLPPLLT